MKKLFNNKKGTIMTMILLFYAILAGGSLDGSLFIGLIVAFLGIIIMSLISGAIQKSKKNARIEKLKSFEKEITDFDISDKKGDDKCTLYYDKTKEAVMIASVNEKAVTKYQIENFKKCNLSWGMGTICAVDTERRKALLVTDYATLESNISIVEYSKNDENRDFVSSNSIKPILRQLSCSEYAAATSTDLINSYILIEESFGYISIFKKNRLHDAFNYISKEYISLKNEKVKDCVSVKSKGPYIFVSDDYFKILTIITPNSHHVLSYSDIINITYEENGNTLFSKKTGRTVGGALVGGALLGSAGAIVGGLSGDTTQSKVVTSMKLKILVRDTKSPTITLPVSFKKEQFDTKEQTKKTSYETRLKWANDIKDLISVIIDKGINNPFLKETEETVDERKKDEEVSTHNISIADEILKLSKLKESGVITEEEFQSQKAKLLK